RMTLTSEIFPEDQILVIQQFVASGPGTIVATTWEFPNAAALNRYVALGGPERQKGASARLDALLSQMLPKSHSPRDADHTRSPRGLKALSLHWNPSAETQRL